MPDPISLQVFHNLFSSVAEEMGVALGRSAFSVNIKERQDYSCALFDPQARRWPRQPTYPFTWGLCRRPWRPTSKDSWEHSMDRLLG